MSSTFQTVQITGLGTEAAPLDYLVKDSQVIGLEAVSATFDGTSAGSAFRPCIQIITDSGHVLASCPATAAADGDSVEVTFAPFLRGQTGGVAVTDGSTTVDPATEIDFTAGATVTDLGGGIAGVAVSGGGGGIAYDTANTGDWLEVAATDSSHNPSVLFTTAGEFTVEDSSGFGSAINLTTHNGGGINIAADSPGAIAINADLVSTPAAVEVDLEPTATFIAGTAAGLFYSDVASKTIEMQGLAGSAVKIAADTTFGVFGIQVGTSSSQKLGFYGATPGLRPAHPTTLSDVINLLTALGLCA